MATIWEKVSFNPYERQAYTKYELSSMVISKRKELGLTLEQLAEKFDVAVPTIQAIEEAKRSFNVPMYKACSAILNISMDEILKKDKEEEFCVSYRKDDSYVCTDKVKETVDLANQIFHEMVMQHKINARN